MYDDTSRNWSLSDPEPRTPLPSIREFLPTPPPLPDQFQAGRSPTRSYSGSDSNDKAKITTPSPAAARTRTRRKERKRWGLPITIDGRAVPSRLLPPQIPGLTRALSRLSWPSVLDLEFRWLTKKTCSSHWPTGG